MIQLNGQIECPLRQSPTGGRVQDPNRLNNLISDASTAAGSGRHLAIVAASSVRCNATSDKSVVDVSRAIHREIRDR